METKHKYWILFAILFIALIWTIKNKHQKEIEEGFENNEYDYISDIEAARVQLSNLLGLLLDDQLFANQIIIDYNLISVRDLVEKNKKNISLNLKPILRNDQFRIITRYLLLNDIYFTGETQDVNKIITFSRNKNFVKPKEIFDSSITEINQLNEFRKNYHLNKMMYLGYKWISNKVNNFITNYGLTMYNMSMENITEVFGKKYWQGYKYLTKSNFYDLPINTVLYIKENKNLCIKIANNSWYIQNINIDQQITNFQRIIVNPTTNWTFWKNIIKKAKDNTTNLEDNQMSSGNYFLLRTSSEFDITRLYQKIDEMSQNNYFTEGINSVYDKSIKLPNGLELVYTQLERMKLLKKWIESITNEPVEQKIYLENIILDLNQRVINMFDDVVCYLIFYQIEDFSELYLDTYIKLNDTIGDWWSAYNFSSVLTNSTNLGQCYLPAVFSINQIQETPPIFKFVYNKNLYHTFWDPLQIYISDMETFLSNKFKTTTVNKLAPIARFCLFNNSSLRNYLAKYITCTTDKCTTDLSYMKEPDRCGALKLKYQELMTQKMKFKCLYKEATTTPSTPTPQKQIENFESNILGQTSEDLQDEFTDKESLENKILKEQEIKINQMFGFRNLLLLNLVEYAIKYHKCQIESIIIGSCQDIQDKIDTNDKKDDLKLNEVIVDRQSDLFNEYDSLLDEYNKILKNQETKKLEPLNILANLDQKTKNNKNINILNKSADDFYSIVNDLTNLGDRVSLKYKDNTVESFDNQLDDNMDLSENTFQKYKNRIQSQIKGLHNSTNVGYLVQVKNMFYELVDILTKDGRIMTSGMFILIISLSLYFIDITS
jgi:hypothetical protein